MSRIRNTAFDSPLQILRRLAQCWAVGNREMELARAQTDLAAAAFLVHHANVGSGAENLRQGYLTSLVFFRAQKVLLRRRQDCGLHHFNADSDLSFHYNADSDSTISDANLRPMV
jgi:hypothetical protein